MNVPTPVEIKLHQQTRVLEVKFDDGSDYRYACEFLRVNSPSAEVQGHGPGQETLQTGKENVNISSIEPVGNYGIKPVFSDGHDTGIFSWETLFIMGQNYDAIWQDYLDRLEKSGYQRKVGDA